VLPPGRASEVTSPSATMSSLMPITWNEFLPISMPITATALLRFWDMACSLSLEPLARFDAGGAGARPDHSIRRHSERAILH